MATQEERKAETRQLLLDAAADLFARKGVHAVSVDAVAEAAGRTSGAVYAHFGGKDGLLLALADRWSGEAAARITAGLADAGTIDERLNAIWQGYGTAGEGAEDDAADGVSEVTDPSAGEAWSLLEHELWLEANRRPEVADRVGARFASGRRRTGEGLASWAAEAGSTPAFEADDLGTVVLGLLYGLQMQRRLDPTAVPDDLARRALRLVLGLPPTAGDVPPTESDRRPSATGPTTTHQSATCESTTHEGN